MNRVWVSCAVDKKECLLGSMQVSSISMCCYIYCDCEVDCRCLLWLKTLFDHVLVPFGDANFLRIWCLNIISVVIIWSVCGSVLYSSSENFVGHSIVWNSLTWCVMTTTVYYLWWSTLKFHAHWRLLKWAWIFHVHVCEILRSYLIV